MVFSGSLQGARMQRTRYEVPVGRTWCRRRACQGRAAAVPGVRVVLRDEGVVPDGSSVGAGLIRGMVCRLVWRAGGGCFQRFIHRCLPLPVGSRLRTVK
jgi:hypothetical protein